MAKNSRKIIIISAAAVLVVAFVSVYLFVFGKSKEPEPVIVEVTEAVTTPPEETEPPETTTQPLVPEYHSGLYLKAQEAHKINSDVVGWIRISNTNVDYAVLQTTDNDLYIDHGE